MQAHSQPEARALSAPRSLEFFREGKNNKAVLLIHGITGSPVEMKFIGKALHRAGYTVYAPLLDGHGLDLAVLRKSQWQDWYNSVFRAASKLREDFDTLYVAGVCVGGMLGLRLASETRLVRAAAVYSPLLQYDGWNAPLHYRFGHLTVPVAVGLGVSRWINLKERPPFGIKSDRIRRYLMERGDGIRGTLPAFPVDTLHQNLKFLAEIKSHLPKVSIPTLLVHAHDDDLAGPGNAAYIQAKIGGPCEIEWLSNSYHMVHVDQEHPIVAERTRQFFDRNL